MRETDPKSWVLWRKNINYAADEDFPMEALGYNPQFTEFRRVTQEMKDWVKDELPSRDRPKTLMIWGPSRTGKSSWARSLGRHSYLNNAWSVEEVDSASDYIVIDDMPWTEAHHFKLWQPFLGEAFTSIHSYLLTWRW